MNTLTKTQVLALFLGSASAAPIDSLKAITDVNSIPTDQDPFTTVSSGSECNEDASCPAETESCARFQVDGSETTEDMCINTEMCGALGRDNNVLWSAQCWTVAKGEAPAVAPANRASIADTFAAVESVITKTTFNFDSATDILVSPRFNYQDGWFIKDAENKWVETDKPTDNRCFLDLQCNSDQCCATYPDTTARRCILKTEHQIKISVGPITFIPDCISLDDRETGEAGEKEVVPENAQDDIAKGALSKANEELDNWRASLLKDAKTTAGYDGDDCDQACKDKFDADWKAETDKYDEVVKGLKTDAGYDDKECDETCKAVFEGELLKWEKEVYETCKAGPKTIQCVKATDLKQDVEKSRGKDYYTGDAAKREEADKAYEEAEKALEAKLTAAWTEENKPAAGKEGGTCSETVTCEATLCCGNRTKAGATAADVGTFCQNSTTLKWTDPTFDDEYTHVCTGLNAMKIGSSIAATMLAAYYM